jgi:opacity protein-like surface antigen
MQGGGSTFGLGASASWGTIAPNVGLESHIEYWSNSDNAYGFEASVRDISLGARARYFFNVPDSPIRPFAGGGLGLHFLREEITIPVFFGFPSQSTSESQTKFGVDLGGGFATSLSPSYDIVGEAWFGIVSNVNQLSLRVGISYNLGS